MKYFEIDHTVRHHSFSELVQREGFAKQLNGAELMHVLEEQLRPLGLQPHLIALTADWAFEILPASKKFINREGSHARVISKRAQEYINFCEAADGSGK